MNITQGTYTHAFAVNSTSGAQQFKYYTPSSKIITGDVSEGRLCTFILLDDTQIQLKLYSGTVIPLCTKACKFEDSVTDNESITVMDSVEAPVPAPEGFEQTTATSTAVTAGCSGETVDLTHIFAPGAQIQQIQNCSDVQYTATLPNDFPGGFYIQNGNVTGSIGVDKAGSTVTLDPGVIVAWSEQTISITNPNLDVNTIAATPSSTTSLSDKLGGADELTIGSGSYTTSQGDTVTTLSGPSMNKLMRSTGPYGDETVILRTADLDANDDFEGGYEWKHNGNRDTNKTYMYVLFMRVTELGAINSDNHYPYFFHGLNNDYYNGVSALGSTSRYNNPYFNYGTIDKLPIGVWCVSIGFLHSVGSTVNDVKNTGGVFRMDTGQRIFGSYHNDSISSTYASGEYQMNSTNASHETRAYLYYGTGGGATLDFYGPSVIEMSSTGVEPGDIVSGNYVVN